MDYNEFAERVKTKHPEYKDMDNMELSRRMVAKYPEYQSQVDFGATDAMGGGMSTPSESSEKRGIDISPRGLGSMVGNALGAAINSKRYNIPYKEAYQQAEEKTKAFDEEPMNKAGNFIADMALYSSLPMLKGTQGASLLGKTGTFLGNAAIQGGVPGTIEGLKEGNALGGAGLGTGIAAGMQGLLSGIPYVGKGVQRVINSPRFQNSTAKTLEALTSVPEDYVQLALNDELAGNSIFKGNFDADTAYIPIERKLREAKNALPTKEGFAQEYRRLGDKAIQGMNSIKEQAGQEINDMLGKIKPEEIDITGLKNSVNSLIKGYARGGDINPAELRAGKDIDFIKDLLKIDNSENSSKLLGEYFNKNRLKIGEVGAGLDKEAQDVAFNVLSQATGKNKQWLKSQLNANLPKQSTQKRQEFIQELIDGADDKISNIDPAWRNYFPELTYENTQGGKGDVIARQMFDKIMGKDFAKAENLLSPAEQAINEASNKYDNILYNLTQNSGKQAQNQSYNDLMKIVENLDDDAKSMFIEKFANDFENIEAIKNPQIKPIDLHNIKETLYDMANYDTAGGTKNDVLKGTANQINNFLRNKLPQYAKPNDRYSLIMDVERGLDGENTIANKIRNIGSDGNILSGLDNRLKNIDNLLPAQNKFFKQAKEIIDSEKGIENIRSTIGKQYEKNPRLLGNRTDEAFNNALDDLQKITNTEFMPELNRIRAREAMEKLFPGQGGGSGSAQGFGNLLRTGLATSSPMAALLAGNPTPLLGLATISPKIMAKGTVKNLGKIYKAAGLKVPENLNKILTPLAVKGSVPLLYGGISND